MAKFDLVGSIIEYESGSLSAENTIELFSELIKTGQCWSLQGHYGRVASALIKDGWISQKGEILKHPNREEIRFNKIKEFEEMATSMVGDGKNPNLFFVGLKGKIITVTQDFEIAYRQWQGLGRSQETSLEDRKTGTIATVQPKEDDSEVLEVIDDSNYLKYRR